MQPRRTHRRPNRRTPDQIVVLAAIRDGARTARDLALIAGPEIGYGRVALALEQLLRRGLVVDVSPGGLHTDDELVAVRATLGVCDS